jgi:lysophospholipid acyltransferase (LPLAT)-like uncharacterized protein
LIRRWVLPPLIFVLYFFWTRSWRLKIVESEGFKRVMKNKEPAVFAFWHGDELVMISLATRYKVATMTSTSKDGELLDRVVNWIGVRTSRGSSTRGGVSALKGLLRLSKAGFSPAIAVDGPKGPLHKAKPGVFQVSKTLKASILPIGFAASHKYVFQKAWNKAQLPLPFSKVVVVWGDPVTLSSNQDPRDQELAKRLEQALAATGQAASKLIAPPSAQC